MPLTSKDLDLFGTQELLEAMKCQRDHGISYEDIWPRGLLSRARDERLQNFARHRLP